MSGPKAVAIVVLLAAPVLQGCGIGTRDGADDGAPLLVFAASSLRAALEELVTLYEAETGEWVEVVLGSTGMLATQIRQGAPADMLIAADASFVDDLVEAGAADAASRRLYALGRLALVARPGAAPPPGVGSLAGAAYEVVAIANPEHAPYGAAAREALRASGAWPAVSGRLVFGESVVQAHQLVRTGNADAGIVALSLVGGAAGDGEAFTPVPDSLHAPLRQVAVVTSSSEKPVRAARFLDFVLSPTGRAVLLRHGLGLPSAAAP